MTIIVDSDEYKCWHEVGHATICVHLGGEVEFMEFLVGHELGYARTRCDAGPANDRLVACGGFAAEFFLLDNGWAQKREDDDRDISQIVFHNASADRQLFWDRPVDTNVDFSEAEDRTFMSCALENVAPIFSRYLPGMQALVRELLQARRVEGSRAMELLKLNTGR